MLLGCALPSKLFILCAPGTRNWHRPLSQDSSLLHDLSTSLNQLDFCLLICKIDDTWMSSNGPTSALMLLNTWTDIRQPFCKDINKCGYAIICTECSSVLNFQKKTLNKALKWSHWRHGLGVKEWLTEQKWEFTDSLLCKFSPLFWAWSSYLPKKGAGWKIRKYFWAFLITSFLWFSSWAQILPQ